jgi:hypothetical protein
MISHTHVFEFASLHWLEDGSYRERQVCGCGERKIKLLGPTPIDEGYLIGKLKDNTPPSSRATKNGGHYGAYGRACTCPTCRRRPDDSEAGHVTFNPGPGPMRCSTCPTSRRSIT